MTPHCGWLLLPVVKPFAFPTHLMHCALARGVHVRLWLVPSNPEQEHSTRSAPARQGSSMTVVLPTDPVPVDVVRGGGAASGAGSTGAPLLSC